MMNSVLLCSTVNVNMLSKTILITLNQYKDKMTQHTQYSWYEIWGFKRIILFCVLTFLISYNKIPNLASKDEDKVCLIFI